MFLPIGDEPNPPGVPVVNYVLIGINVLVFVVFCFPLTMQAPDQTDPAFLEYVRLMVGQTGAPPALIVQQMSAYDLVVYQYGFKPAMPSLADLCSAMFLHAGWLHLLGNMLFLWIFGDNVELHVGRIRYALLYLLTGMLGTLFFALFRLDSAVPLVGASGAISGVLGCYFVWFPHNKVRVLMVLIWFIDVILVPARWVLGFYVLIENLLPFLLDHSGGGVAYGAHIGGFLGGAGFATLMTRWRHRDAVLGGSYWQRARAAAAAKEPAQRFTRALAQGGWDEALREYSVMSIAERNALADEDVFALADWLTEVRRYEPALAILQRYIATHPTSAGLARAHLRAGLILLRGLERPTAAYQHFLSVLDLQPSPDVAQAARLALADIEATGASRGPRR